MSSFSFDAENGKTVLYILLLSWLAGNESASLSSIMSYHVHAVNEKTTFYRSITKSQLYAIF